jgi:hypothetical protein
LGDFTCQKITTPCQITKNFSEKPLKVCYTTGLMVARETDKIPQFKTNSLSQKRLPRDVRALTVTTPEIGDYIKTLQQSGVPVARRILVKTAPYVRTIVHSGDNAKQVIENALASGNTEKDDLAPVKEAISQAYIFTPDTSKPLTEEAQATLAALNDHHDVQERRIKLAKRRLANDRPQKVIRRFQKSGGIIGVTAILADIAEKFGGHGILRTAGLVLAQATDDTVNTIVIPATEKGGTKRVKQIVKDNVMLLPVIAAAGVADFYAIPPLLESSSVVVRLAGGFSYAFFAVVGSLSANVAHLIRTQKEKKEAGQGTTVMQQLKHAWKDHISDPFRKNIWYGGGITFASSMAAAGFKILIDKDYSGLLQTVLGIESLPAFAGLLFFDRFASLKERISDYITIAKGKRDAIHRRETRNGSNWSRTEKQIFP